VGNASPHFTGSGDVSLGAGTAAASEPITDAEVAGVRLGSAIEEVIGLLGQPAFALTGIAGKSYTEKYVFKRGDGATIIVFTWNGAVTAISLS
jgi:hypothetical protein